MQKNPDDIKYVAKRHRLVNELKLKGIQSPKVLEAISRVPRHRFFREDLVQFAYQDNAYMIDAGQTISQPYTVAFQSQLLNINAGDSVLEIGTGSGYQAAVLCEMGANVVTIERHTILHKKSSSLLSLLGYKIKTLLGDGYEGYVQSAPYKGIIITAAAPFIPKTLLRQLAIDGKLIIPLGEGEKQVMTRITRVSESDFKTEQFGDFAFVPMLKGVE